MELQEPIRILEKDANKRGDLFGKLMEGLFVALGYDRIRLNIHKSGREIDLDGRHRTEDRRVIAECKATDEPVGGQDVNKFVGALDAEKRRRPNLPTEGYFVSLNGFTETAVEQEEELGNGRVTLLTGWKAIEQLTKGRVVVLESRAMELAGRCAGALATDVFPQDHCQLLAHEIGWLWLIYFTQNKQKSHFALVHADGQLVSQDIAAKVVTADRALGGDLHQLQYLSPIREDSPTQAAMKTARQSYEAYLAEQCGEIQLEGLPTDQEIGSSRLKLENTFVPLFLREVPESIEGTPTPPLGKDPSDVDIAPDDPSAPKYKHARGKRLSVGKALSKSTRLAILGPPGGGKSTLLKRIAVAYASPDRRQLIKDHLPKRPWLPLLIRCRQLDKLARRPISEILDDIPARAELPPELHAPFNDLVRRSLRGGEAVLLVDGLDEISEEGDRVSFVNQLRTFLTTYPNVALVVTSREAGFRVIGGALSTHCSHYELAEFENGDIRKLTLAWHVLVEGDNAKVRRDASQLADTICASARVRQLAENPMLLTTLLLVQRWVGQLPTKRTVLYAKAIEVLLMTWNVEAHQPLDPEEALPQLEFLAMHMMKKKSQRISMRELTEVLAKARRQMPEILGFARMSIGNFIKRVELRSSLLMATGHQVDQGTLSPVYEFRHLTFQEYLAARAAAYGHSPDRGDSDDMASVLRPYINDLQWKEVIPLAAVLAGRGCRPLISDLITKSRDYQDEQNGSATRNREAHEEERIPLPWLLLSTCLCDEVQVSPELLREAMQCVVERYPERGSFRTLADSKYGAVFEETARTAFMDGRNVLNIGGYFSLFGEKSLGFREGRPLTREISDRIEGLLQGSDPWNVAIGCLSAMHIAYIRATPNQRRAKARPARLARLLTVDSKILENWLLRILPLTKSAQEAVQFSANWGFVWLAQSTNWDPTLAPGVIADFVSIWQATVEKPWGYIPAWILSTLRLVNRDSRPIPCLHPDLLKFIEARASGSGLYEKWAALTVAYYMRAPWSDGELVEFLSAKQERTWIPGIRDRLLKALGAPTPNQAPRGR